MALGELGRSIGEKEEVWSHLARRLIDSCRDSRHGDASRTWKGRRWKGGRTRRRTKKAKTGQGVKGQGGNYGLGVASRLGDDGGRWCSVRPWTIAIAIVSLAKRSRQKREERKVCRNKRGEGVRKNVCLGRFCKRPAPLPATRGRECQHDSHTRSNLKRMESNKLERSLRLTRQRAVAKRIDRSERFIVETVLVHARWRVLSSKVS